GMFVISNGGTTWTKVTGIPVGSAAGITGILFDPTSRVVGGATQGIYAASYGNGVYHSTDGGATWTQLAGGPTDVEYAAISSTGVYYAVNDNNGATALWRYSGGVWTQSTLQGSPGQWPLGSEAINPSNPNEIVAICWNGAYNVSYDGGSTWSDWYSPKTS